MANYIPEHFFLVGICLLIFSTPFAKAMEKALQLAVPCEVIRKDSVPLGGRLCYFTGKQVLVQLCNKEFCRANVGDIRKNIHFTCGDDTPASPGFANKDSIERLLFESFKTAAEGKSERITFSGTESLSTMKGSIKKSPFVVIDVNGRENMDKLMRALSNTPMAGAMASAGSLVGVVGINGNPETALTYSSLGRIAPLKLEDAAQPCLSYPGQNISPQSGNAGTTKEK